VPPVPKDSVTTKRRFRNIGLTTIELSTRVPKSAKLMRSTLGFTNAFILF